MEALLKKITQDYRAFVDDQVLTAGQLNEFINFFEDQDRLSRVCLTGAGIACGFQVSKTGNVISITQGCALTTDGDLLKLLSTNEDGEKFLAQGQINYTFFKKFEDKRAKYAHFIKNAGAADEAHIDLWELIPEGTQTDEDSSLNLLDLNNKVVLLYLESYPKTPDICTETNCDNQGERHVARLRVLLVNEEDMDLITGMDNVFTRHDTLGVYSLLPEIKMPRLLLKTGVQEQKNPPKIDLTALLDLDVFRKDLVIDTVSLTKGLTSQKTSSGTESIKENTIFKDLTERVSTNTIPTRINPSLKLNTDLLDISRFITIPSFAVQINTQTYAALSNSYKGLILVTINELQRGYQALYDGFSPLLKISAKAKNNINDHLEKLKSNLPGLNIQYVYDHVRDLVQTYTGIKDLLYRIQVECCPTVEAFPKHIMLGQLGYTGRIPKYRHAFYHSELHPSSEFLKRAKFLSQRLATLCASFKLFADSEIKITPSMWYPSLPGPKGGATHNAASIPFYYDVSNVLLQAWDYDMTAAYRESYNLSYHKDFLNKASSIQNPLLYDLSDYDFLRIEGVQGKEYDDVIKELETLKKDKGLSFDIKAVSIDQKIEDVDLEEYACHFGFLETSLKGWTAEQDCLNADVTKFFSGFNLRTPGLHNYASGMFTRASTGISLNTEKTAGSTLRLLSDSKTTATGARATILANAASAEKNTKAPTTENSKQVRVPLNPGIEYIAPIKKEVPVNKVVKEELNTKNNDLGLVIKNILTDKYVGNYLDIFADFDKNVKELYPLQPEVKTDVVKISREIPAKIIALLQVASSYIPATLNQVTESTKENFSSAMDDLCNYVTEAIDDVNKIFYAPNSTYEWVGYENVYMTLLYRLQENCCAAERLEILITEIQDRKTAILDDLILENFARKHPGLEHKAGVPMGGTFVLVYSGAVRDAEDQSIPVNTVVADFCLPYQCCSDCAPIGFIVPDLVGQGTIILEEDELCLDEKGEESITVGMTVSPKDGIISLTDSSITGVTISGNAIHIDPVDFNGYDVPLSFTVNGQLTNAKLTAYKKPALSITYTPQKPTSLRGNSVNLEFGFVNENNFNPRRFTFKWVIDDVEYTSENPIHTVKISQDYDKNVYGLTASLTLTGNICGAEVSEEIIEIDIVEQQDTRIEMEFTEFCEGDKEPYEIFVVPPSKDVVIDSKGVTQRDGQFFFIPSEVEPGPHEITLVGGNTIDVLISTRIKQLSIVKAFDAKEKKYTISSSIKDDALEYIWLLNGEQDEELKDSAIEIKLDRLRATSTLSLIIPQSPCPDLKSNEVTLDVDVQEDEISIFMDTTEFCDNDENKYSIDVIPEGADILIEGDGVEPGEKGFVFIPAKAKKGLNTITSTDAINSIPVTVTARPGKPVIEDGHDDPTSNNRVYETTFDEPGAIYTWTFNDEVLTSFTDKKVSFPLSEPREGVLQLTVSVGPCGEIKSDEKTVKIEVRDIVPPSISIDGRSFCSDNVSVFINLTPSDSQAVVSTEKEGAVSKNTDGKWIFMANKAGVGTHTIHVEDGNSIDVTVAKKVATATLTEEQVSKEGKDFLVVTCSFNSPSAEYKWTFNGQNMPEAKGNQVFFPGSAPLEGKLKLVITNPPCGTIDVPEKNIRIEGNIEKDCTKNAQDNSQANVEKIDEILKNAGDETWLVTETERLQGIYDTVLNDPKYWNGENIGLIENTFSKQIEDSKMAAIEMIHGEQQPSPYFELYRLSIELFYNLIRCHTDEKIANLGGIMFNIENHFNPAADDSFYKHRDDFNPGEDLQAYINNLVDNAQSEAVKSHAKKIQGFIK